MTSNFSASIGNSLGSNALNDYAQTNKYSNLNNYNDLNGLQSLKHASKSDKEGALDEVAKHFESIFVSMMIKSMRDANKVFSEGNMLQSSEGDFYQQMFDSQLAVSLSTSKSIGLADVIKRQLSKDHSPQHSVNEGGLPLNPVKEAKLYSLENYARQPFVSKIDVSQLQQTVDKIDTTLNSVSSSAVVGNVFSIDSPRIDSPRIDNPSTEIPSNEATNDVAISTTVDFSSPEKYINSLYPYAKGVELQTGIDARLLLAQSALETGWGQRQILNADGSPSFNLFGIKAQTDWKGNSTDITTTEYRQGIPMKERASFRAYDSYQDSFADYAQFLKSNERYESAMQHSDNPKAFASQLQNAGYATDPLYANKISRIVDQYFWPEAEGAKQND